MTFNNWVECKSALKIGDIVDYCVNTVSRPKKIIELRERDFIVTDLEYPQRLALYYDGTWWKPRPREETPFTESIDYCMD